ncbi:MAG: hypothetical protein WBO55_10835 [Rhizobiaceae bacterium]
MFVLEGICVFATGVILFFWLGSIARKGGGGWLIQSELPSNLLLIVLVTAISLGFLLMWVGAFDLTTSALADIAAGCAATVAGIAISIVALRMLRVGFVS